MSPFLLSFLFYFRNIEVHSLGINLLHPECSLLCPVKFAPAPKASMSRIIQVCVHQSQATINILQGGNIIYKRHQELPKLFGIHPRCWPAHLLQEANESSTSADFTKTKSTSFPGRREIPPSPPLAFSALNWRQFTKTSLYFNVGNQSNFYNLWHTDRPKASDEVACVKDKTKRDSSLCAVSSQLHNHVVPPNLENAALLSQG